MDQVSAGKVTRDGARTRRRHMREQARSQHAAPSPATDRYQTPEWLDRSFVLPLSSPEASDVPAQSVPHHDDRLATDSVPTPTASPRQFLRPPSDDIDFAQVVHRSDLCRRATRLAVAGAGIAGVTLIAYLLSSSALALAATVALALVSVGALVWRARLVHAPVPRLQR